MKNRYLWFIPAVLIISVLIVLAVVPVHVIEQLPSICLIKRVCGVSCPGCGMTRAIASLLHGRYARAINFNPFAVEALIALCMIAIADVLFTLKRHSQ